MSIFYREAGMCLAINRNLLNLLDTLRIIRYLSEPVDGILRELRDSLQLCQNFLQEFCASKGYQPRKLSQEEEEQVTNKLAFMNKLLHLNQHSLNIRLLMEASDHARLAAQWKQEDAARKPVASSASSSSVASLGLLGSDDRNTLLGGGGGAGGGGAGDVSRPKLSQLAYGKPHFSQVAFGPIAPPPRFVPATRQKEWEQIESALAQFPPDMPCILFITGPPGVGKTTYARYVTQKLSGYLEYHCYFQCHSPDTALSEFGIKTDEPRKGDAGAGGDAAPSNMVDAETIMRFCMAPSQLEGLSSLEVQRAFRALFWRRRGVLLIDNAQSEAQVASLLPTRGVCFVIVTSTKPLQGLLQRAPKVCKIHQHLEPIPRAACRALFEGGAPIQRINEEESSLLGALCERSPAALDVVRHYLAKHSAADVIKKLSETPDAAESKVLGRFNSSVAKSTQRILYLLFRGLPKPSQTLFSRLFIFPGAFETHAALEIMQMALPAFQQAAQPLLEAGLLREPEDAPAGRRRAATADDMGGLVAGSEAAAEVGADMKQQPQSWTWRPIGLDSRFWLHEVVRDFSQALGASELPKETMQRFCEHYCEVLETVDDDLEASSAQRQALGFRIFDREMHNIRFAVELACSAPSFFIPAEITARLLHPRPAFERRFSPARRVDIYSAYMTVIAAATPGGPGHKDATKAALAQLDVFKCLADAHLASGRYEKAIPYYKQCQKRAEQSGIDLYVASALRGLAKVSELLSEYEIALDYCQRCRKTLEKMRDQRELGRLLLFVSDLYKPLSNNDKVIEAAQEARQIAEAASDLETVAKALFNVGDALMRKEDVNGSIAPLKDAALISQKIGDLRTLAAALRSLDRAHESLGRFYKAHCYRERLAQLMSHSDLPLL